MLTLTDIATATQGIIHGNDVACTGVSIDSRSVSPGDLFIAIKGEHCDGHAFIEQAIQQGAKALLVSQVVDTDFPHILVPDTRLALGQLAASWAAQFHLPVVAITGSVGKTTVKEMIASILQLKGPVLATSGNLNNDFGVPLTLLKLNATHQFAVIEMGANHLGEIAYLTGLIQPDVAVITKVAAAHIQGFGSLEGVAKAKGEIFAGLKDGGVAVINADQEYLKIWAPNLTDKTVSSFALSGKSDYFASDIIFDDKACANFVLHTPTGNVYVRLPLPGKHNIANALAAAAACQALHVSLSDIGLGLSRVSEVSKRLNFRTLAIGASIIDDTYNANLASVSAGLEVLAAFPGKRVLVMGDMGELGDETLKHHQKIGEIANELAIDVVLTKGSFAQHIADTFRGETYHFDNYPDLISAVQSLLGPMVTVLVKGSRSAQMEIVVAKLV